MVQIRKAEADDLQSIHDMAQVVFRNTYKEILSPDQMEYMMEMMYSFPNLRKQLERLNQYSFTDKEWDSFFKHKIANANEGIVEKTRKIQEDYVQNLTCEDGRTQNIYLIDKKNIHNKVCNIPG